MGFGSRDALLLVSLTCVLYGLSGWSVPLAYVVGGGIGLGAWCWPHIAIAKAIGTRASGAR